MNSAKNLIDNALDWLGYNEADGSHKIIIDYYNQLDPLPRGYKMTYNDPWCAAFVSAVALKSNCADIIPPECSCTKMIEGFKKLGRWYSFDKHYPSPGDIIFYDWNGNGGSDHVGIVTSVASRTVEVLEGNKSNAVGYRTIYLGSRYIFGYGVPAYSAIPKNLDELAYEVIQGKWGNAPVRKTLLTNAGYDYEAVQSRVNEILLEGT